MMKRGSGERENRRPSAMRWRQIVQSALRAASAAVRRLPPESGQRVVGGRQAGYRPWDPEIIAVDTAAERAVRQALLRSGLWGTLLSEEAGMTTLGAANAQVEPVYVILDPFDGSLFYRRGIRAHWFTGLGIYGPDEGPKAAGVVDHITGELVLADADGAVMIPREGARPLPLRPARTASLDGAFLEAYLMKPSFLYPTATALQPLFERAKLILGNGGPCGFADVASGRIDVYLAWNESLTEVFSAAYIAEKAGCVVSHWDGSPLRFRPDIDAVYNLVCSANPALHRRALEVLKGIAPPKGLAP